MTQTTQSDDGRDILTKIATLRDVSSELEGELWDAVLEARRQEISLRRVARAAGISTSQLDRKLKGGE